MFVSASENIDQDEKNGVANYHAVRKVVVKILKDVVNVDHRIITFCHNKVVLCMKNRWRKVSDS